MRRNPANPLLRSLPLALLLLSLAACGAQPRTQPARQSLLGTPESLDAPCELCSQATLAALQTEEKFAADSRAAATAAIMRANAQATLDSANATLSAARTQEQNKVNILAAQIAGTAEIVRANAQATLSAAGSTQSAALTQDAIRQTQMAGQQIRDLFADGTQTAVSNDIATQTRAAAATSQWYAGQDRQRAEQMQGPLTFLLLWCLPVFVMVLAGLALWGVWRWLRIQQANQRLLEPLVDQLPEPPMQVLHDRRQGDTPPYLADPAVGRYRLTKPDDQVRRWLDEVKRKLLDGDKEDEDGKPDA